MQNTPKVKELQLSNKPKLYITPELQALIDYGHKLVPGLEWSGPLVYKVVSGDLQHPSSLVLRAENFYPMHIGTSGYTEFASGEQMIDMYDTIPGSELESRIGLIHTH